MVSTKEGVKQVLGALPFTAELDWHLRLRRTPLRGFKLNELDAALADWQAQAAACTSVPAAPWHPGPSSPALSMMSASTTGR